jgi:hypothetical protein
VSGDVPEGQGAEAAEVPLGAGPCPECEHGLMTHSASLGCWLCECTFGRPRAARQGAAEAARYVQAWFVFVGADGNGRLSTDRAARCISIGATHGGRVRVNMPEGLGDIAPEVADRVAGRIAEAAAIARQGAAIAPLLRRAETGLACCPECLADGELPYLTEYFERDGQTFMLRRYACAECATDWSTEAEVPAAYGRAAEGQGATPAAIVAEADDFDLIREFDAKTRADYPERN